MVSQAPVAPVTLRRRASQIVPATEASRERRLTLSTGGERSSQRIAILTRMAARTRAADRIRRHRTLRGHPGWGSVPLAQAIADERRS